MDKDMELSSSAVASNSPTNRYIYLSDKIEFNLLISRISSKILVRNSIIYNVSTIGTKE